MGLAPPSAAQPLWHPPCRPQAAIRDAAASPRGGVVYVPPGTFLLNNPLYVNVSRVIIRGAGPTRSKLLFGRSLGQIYKGSWAVDACSGGCSLGQIFSKQIYRGSWACVQAWHRGSRGAGCSQLGQAWHSGLACPAWRGAGQLIGKGAG